jgi:CBS domain-containing protein
MPNTVREFMHEGCECIGENASVLDAARKLAEMDVGALPICGEDNRLKGMVTDRDIVVKVLAQGKDPAQTRAGELGAGKPIYVAADDQLDEALRLMRDNQVRRLPVIQDHRLVGMLAQADIARRADDARTGATVEAISQN